MFTYFPSFLQIPYKNEDPYIFYVYLLVTSHVILYNLCKSVWRKGATRAGVCVPSCQPLLVCYTGSCCPLQAVLPAVLRAWGRNWDAFAFPHTVNHVPSLVGEFRASWAVSSEICWNRTSRACWQNSVALGYSRITEETANTWGSTALLCTQGISQGLASQVCSIYLKPSLKALLWSVGATPVMSHTKKCFPVPPKIMPR